MTYFGVLSLYTTPVKYSRHIIDVHFNIVDVDVVDAVVQCATAQGELKPGSSPPAPQQEILLSLTTCTTTRKLELGNPG